jgi:glutamate synthase (NADPH/NADH) large chain
MGFVAKVDGVATRELIVNALTMLERMNHRGGTGAEPDTGDGAGILMAIPHEFFARVIKEKEEVYPNGEIVELPESGDYAVGQLFLPKNPDSAAALLAAVEKEITDLGYRVITQREVPFEYKQCGPSAQKVMPSFVQIFVKRPSDVEAGRPFEDALYKLRLEIERIFDANELNICSLSAKTICYKGMLHAYQVGLFFLDLQEPDFKSRIALVHSRFSTNTFPSWDRAQPFRYMAHNGEINTLAGAENWMNAHHIKIYNEENSDSAKLENCMEYLYQNGREIPESLMMLIPAAHSKESLLPGPVEAFYEYANAFMAPWDGPAAICFTDGDIVGATLDRNGLRPSRYVRTTDNYIILSSESGCVDVEPSRIAEKGVLKASDMLVIDTKNNQFYHNDDVKARYSSKHPYERWVKEEIVHITESSDFYLDSPQKITDIEVERLWKLNNYGDDVIRSVILPMSENGEEPVVSMGYDSPLSVLSEKPEVLFTYFKQQFAQVTNPPIDALREKLVIDTSMFLGRANDITQNVADNAAKVKIASPILGPSAFGEILKLNTSKQSSKVITTLYNKDTKVKNRLEQALYNMFKAAEEAIDDGATIIILSDRSKDGINYAIQQEGEYKIPILLAVSGLSSYLVKQGKGAHASIVVDSSEVCEVHHFATLIGYGASAIYPYGAYATIAQFTDKTVSHEKFRKAAEKGVVKVMSRMGISTIQGYQGAKLFEALGLSSKVVDEYFAGTATRIEGLSLSDIEDEYIRHHDAAFGARAKDFLESQGGYQYKANGEYHMFNPRTIYNFQKAVRTGDYSLYKEYSNALNQELDDNKTTIRSLWEFKSTRPKVDLSEVEPAKEIVKRFKVGAMSFGSLSKEAHECIAEAMNSIGAKSNSGEGGENRNRFKVQPDGRNLNSRVKQVASGRFGVNAEYLMSADELQIKVAQGAKPGEGGQLPGTKVFPWVAEIRGATPGVRLISPPPHHDIYSIEDLAQLIFDLKAINPYAKINVKLVSSTGVGTIATGVVKAGAHKVVISGFDGGTGASPRNSVRDAGLPFELGLADAHQTLSLNNLRNRAVIETDGKLMTGRDIAISAILGAEEYSFASLALVAIGCVMMRVCSLNTCPVGVATQNPELRKLFTGKPEHIVNMMTFIAEDLREIMADLGFRTVDELIGHVEVLKPKFIARGKAKGLNFDRILTETFPIDRKIEDPFHVARQWDSLDAFAESSVQNGQELEMNATINNVDRTTGARMAGWLAERYGNDKIKDGQLKFNYTGIAGQSFGAFAVKGMQLKVTGEVNDYVAKGLSGARIIVVPPADAPYVPSETPIVGNVAMFGAVTGEGYFHGRAGERFCVRNSGANVVVEGVGDHGCEYMTGGVAVILGSTGRNFAAGMSGGVAYVYIEDATSAADAIAKFTGNCNLEMVELFEFGATTGDEVVKEMIEKHVEFTDSIKGAKILKSFAKNQHKFVKVYPSDFHKMKDIEERLIAQGLTGLELQNKAFEELTGVSVGEVNIEKTSAREVASVSADISDEKVGE